MIKFIKSLFYNTIELGELKSLDDITIEDMKKYPIWVNDLSGENVDGFDEAFERPIINSNNVSDKVIKNYLTVNILVRCKELNLYGSASIYEGVEITNLVFWEGKKWQMINDFIDKNNIIIESIPDIKGKSGLKFEYDLKLDRGKLIN